MRLHADILLADNENIFTAVCFLRKAEENIFIFAQLKLLKRYFRIVQNSGESKAILIIISEILFLCHT